jgi:hypothetical protein
MIPHLEFLGRKVKLALAGTTTLLAYMPASSSVTESAIQKLIYLTYVCKPIVSVWLRWFLLLSRNLLKSIPGTI